MIKIADRTSNTVFFPGSNPLEIGFRSNASDNDTFTVPYGVPDRVVGCNAEDNDDDIASASVSGGTVTLGLVDDAGSSDTADTDIVGFIILRNQ